MKNIIIGFVFLVGIVYYFSAGTTPQSKDGTTIVKKEISKDKQISKVKIVNLDNSLQGISKKQSIVKVVQKSNIIKDIKPQMQKSLKQLYKTNPRKAQYQGIQAGKRSRAIAMQRAKKMYQQRVGQRQQMIARHKQQQRSIAMRTIQRQKIQNRQVEQMNFRYKSINEQNMQRNISKNKQLGQTS